MAMIQNMEGEPADDNDIYRRYKDIMDTWMRKVRIVRLFDMFVGAFNGAARRNRRPLPANAH